MPPVLPVPWLEVVWLWQQGRGWPRCSQGPWSLLGVAVVLVALHTTTHSLSQISLMGLSPRDEFSVSP